MQVLCCRSSTLAHRVYTCVRPPGNLSLHQRVAAFDTVAHYPKRASRPMDLS